MFCITGVFGFIQPFVPLYVAAAGVDRAQYGLMTAIGTATGLLVQPLLGRLSDRLDARRPVMVAAALAAGAAYLAYRSVSGFAEFTVLTALGANGFQYLNAAGGVLVGRMVAASASAGQGGGAAYVRYRIWGSVGYIVVAMTAGTLVKSALGGDAPARADLDPVFTYGPLLFFLIAALSCVVPDVRGVRPSSGPPPGSGPPPRPRSSATPPPINGGRGRAQRGGGGPISESSHRANRFRFLIAFGLYQFGLYGASAYLPVYMAELGATPPWITGMFAAGVVCEVLVMSQVGRWTDTYGRRPALALAFLLMPVRLLLYIPATGPLWVLLVQTLHGINFGVVGTIAVVFVNDTAGDHERGTAQAQMTAAAGLGLSLGPLLCGILAQEFGIRAMFAAMSGIGALAALLFLLLVDESNPDAVPPKARFLRWFARPWRGKAAPHPQE